MLTHALPRRYNSPVPELVRPGKRVTRRLGCLLGPGKAALRRSAVKNAVKRLLQEASLRRFVYRLPSRGSVYLTFDDGPNPQYTRRILEILERMNAAATFFLVGQAVERHGEIVSRIQAADHAIGLHTYSHRTLDRMDSAEFSREIQKNQQAIERITGKRPTLLRPPKGQISLPALVRAARHGLTIVHYTITSNDWKARSVADILDSIGLKRLEGGEIISFHDDNQHTIEALPIIIDTLRTSSFRCASVPSK